MTKEELIEIYIEVSNKLCNGTEWCWAGVGEPLQLFAKLVAAKAAEKERMACALLCYEQRKNWDALACADAIRAGTRPRGQE